MRCTRIRRSDASTLQSRVPSLLGKLGLGDRTQAAIFALQRRLAPLDQALEP